MNLLNKIINNKRIAIIILFLAALILRIFLINTINQNKIAPDGTGYHTIAVNLVKGNGYSNSSTEPFQPYFLREPGYPVFIAAIYKIYNAFAGEAEYLNDYNLTNYSYENSHNEITLVKYFQALLDSITIVLLYLSLLIVFKKKYAFLIVLIISLYYPLAIHVTFILRETIQTFFSMAMAYTFINFLFSRKYIWLIGFSIFWAFLTLTFQAFIILPFFLFIFLFVYFKKLWLSVKLCLIAGIIMLIVSSPWLIHSYTFYPDWRILKSFGTSLTPEYQSYISAVGKAKYYSYINDEDFHNILMSDYINVSAKEKFNISFNGELKFKADSINKIINEPIISRRKVHAVMKSFINSWFRRITLNELGSSLKLNPKYNIFRVNIYSINHLFLTLLGLGIGLLGFLGIVFFYRKIYPLLLIFTMYMSVFFILGTEARRMNPIQSFITMFSILAIFMLYYRLFNKNSFKNSVDEMLNEEYPVNFMNRI